MLRYHRVLTLAVGAYAVAWLLPSVVGQSLLHRGVLPGWEATRVALSPIWRYTYQGTPLGPEDAVWPKAAIAVASGLTNLVFVLAVAWLGWRPQTVRWPLEALVWSAAVLNTQWFLLGGSSRGALRIGYYLWITSYVLIGAALHEARRTLPDRGMRLPAA